MNKKIKQMWIDALRSGEYKQGQEVLHNIETNQFCCLGVLCELARKESIIVRLDDNLAYSYYEDNENDEDKSDLDLPKSVMEWAGIGDSFGEYKEGNFSLSELNDRGRSFKYIANIIEKNF